MIEIQRVTKTFDGCKALDDLTMTVPTGAIYGLVGPNGAGKSTILRHITGVYRQDQGSVLIDGQPVYENPEVKERIADIPDELYRFGSDSTRDMARFYRGFFPRFDQARYEQLRTAFPSIDENAPVRRLSKGMQKQSAFWLALCCRPDILVLDEPVDGLDPVMRRQVWSLLMEDVAREGVTVLVSSHNLRELEDVCDHVGILQRGRCLLERSVSELQEITVKFILALPEDGALPEGLDILYQNLTGRVHTLILRGREEELTERLSAAKPVFLESQPLTLEEIFIYEMGGADYGIRDILL